MKIVATATKKTGGMDYGD